MKVNVWLTLNGKIQMAIPDCNHDKANISTFGNQFLGTLELNVEKPKRVVKKHVVISSVTNNIHGIQINTRDYIPFKAQNIGLTYDVEEDA